MSERKKNDKNATHLEKLSKGHPKRILSCGYTLIHLEQLKCSSDLICCTFKQV